MPQTNNRPGELYKVQVTQNDPQYVTIQENPSALNVIGAVTRDRWSAKWNIQKYSLIGKGRKHLTSRMTKQSLNFIFSN